MAIYFPPLYRGMNGSFVIRRTIKSVADRSSHSWRTYAETEKPQSHVRQTFDQKWQWPCAKRTKMVYYFGGGKADGDGTMKPLLGGKGANLAEMTRIGLPVPAGFTITTEVCTAYYASGKKLPQGLIEEVQQNIAKLERETGKKFGDPKNPLLVAVRSGARDSMPGMMDTILNLGLNDTAVVALANATQNGRFAWDCYRRFVQMYGDVVMGVQ